MILVIDNYDSFTYNLVQQFGELGAEIEVVRNDQLTLDDVRRLNPSHIVISPGPGTPDDGGISLDVIREFGPTTFGCAHCASASRRRAAPISAVSTSRNSCCRCATVPTVPNWWRSRPADRSPWARPRRNSAAIPRSGRRARSRSRARF